MRITVDGEQGKGRTKELQNSVLFDVKAAESYRARLTHLQLPRAKLEVGAHAQSIVHSLHALAATLTIR